MNRSRVWIALSLISAWLVAGCGSAEMSDASTPASITELAKVPGLTVYHDWKEIVSVEVRGKESIEKKVGYLDRTFTEEDPAGKLFVRDLALDIRGFLLPEGKAFVFEPRAADSTNSRDLGNTGVESGVKRILNAPGEIRFRPIAAVSTAPPQS
jgi:hypothetical protein